MLSTTAAISPGTPSAPQGEPDEQAAEGGHDPYRPDGLGQHLPYDEEGPLQDVVVGRGERAPAGSDEGRQRDEGPEADGAQALRFAGRHSLPPQASGSVTSRSRHAV